MAKKQRKPEEKLVSKKHLVITNQETAALTKEQRNFNRLVKKLQQLRSKLKDDESTFEAQLDFYHKYISPIEKETKDSECTLIKLLYPIYKDKKLLSKNDKDIMKIVIRSLLYKIPFADQNGADHELENIFEDIEGVSYDEAASEDFNNMMAGMEQQLRREGVHVDLSNLHKDMPSEEIARKMAEVREKLKEKDQKTEAHKSKSKKTKKQVAEMERELQVQEARTKSISTIYKQLVKVLHPDLEQDEAQKPIKEELMKQLSIAYKNNDLLSLLMLEIEWINNENNNVQQQGDEKLKIYNELLMQQVAEVEKELMLMVRGPRFNVLHEIWDESYSAEQVNIKQVMWDRQERLAVIKDTIDNLRGPNWMKEVKIMMQDYKRALRNPFMAAGQFTMPDDY